jgi:hypothetical protein
VQATERRAFTETHATCRFIHDAKKRDFTDVASNKRARLGLHRKRNAQNLNAAIHQLAPQVKYEPPANAIP